MSGLKRKAFVAAIVGVMGGWSVTPSDAALMVDIRATGVTGGSVTDAKHVTVTGAGSVVSFNIYAVITGANGSTTDEGLTSLAGSLLSSVGGAVAGTTTAVRGTGWTASGSAAGTAVDLDLDGDTDLGSNTNGSATGFWAVRSTSAPTMGNELLIGSGTFTVGSVLDSGSTTSLNFRVRSATTAATWTQDNVAVSGVANDPLQYLAGNSLLVAVPEPATIGLIGLGSLALLRRKRTAC